MVQGKKILAGFYASLLLSAMLCYARTAVAQSCSIDTAHTAAVTFPTSISMPRNAAVGTMLTGWIAANSSDNWTCTKAIDGSYFTVFTDLAMATPNKVSVGGQNFAYMATNIDGIGVIAKATATIVTSIVGSSGNPGTNTNSRGVGAARFYNNQSQQILGIGGTTSSGTSRHVASQTVSLALVKISSASFGGRINAGTFGRTGVRFMSDLNEAAAGATLLYTHNVTYSSVNLVEQTCVTPDVVIPLGDVTTFALRGAGMQTSAWVNRVISINNCPANMNQVKIRFNTPVSGWLDEPNKVFKLNNATAPQTAKGIGLQISFGDGNTIAPYDTFQTLAGYDTIRVTGGSFTVPIGGRYYKPASSTVVSGGMANGVVVFDMLYE